MKRRDIMDEIPENCGEFEGKLKDFIDEIEQQFNKIRDALDDITVNNIGDRIDEAFKIAEDMSDNLY